MALVATLFCSCDRSGRFEFLEREIPWNFCVAVVSDENMTQPVEGATVKSIGPSPTVTKTGTSF